VYINGDANGHVAAQSKPESIYAEIFSSDDVRDKVTPSDTKNEKDIDAVIYSELQAIGAVTHTVAPNGGLYANVKR